MNFKGGVGHGPSLTPILEKGTGGDPHSYGKFVPFKRIDRPEEVPVVWLCLRAAWYVTGNTLPVDGWVCS